MLSLSQENWGPPTVLKLGQFRLNVGKKVTGKVTDKCNGTKVTGYLNYYYNYSSTSMEVWKSSMEVKYGSHQKQQGWNKSVSKVKNNDTFLGRTAVYCYKFKDEK